MDTFLIIIIVHFLADFTLQTHEQAMKKSDGMDPFNKWLFFHVGTYTMVWFIVILGLGYNLNNAVVFSGITFISHYWTDFITSRIGKPFWAKQDFHNGFVVVGYDQVFHYLQLYYTFKLIS